MEARKVFILHEQLNFLKCITFFECFSVLFELDFMYWNKVGAHHSFIQITFESAVKGSATLSVRQGRLPFKCDCHSK